MMWQQVYDPFGNMIISTLLGAISVVIMLLSMGISRPVASGPSPFVNPAPVAHVELGTPAIAPASIVDNIVTLRAPIWRYAQMVVH